MLAESVVQLAEEGAHKVRKKTALVGLDSFEEAGRSKGAQDCQMPAVARNMPSDSGLRGELASPYLGCLEMAVDTVAGSEDSRRMTDVDKVLEFDSKYLEVVEAAVVVVVGKEAESYSYSSPWSRQIDEQEARSFTCYVR